MEVKWIKIVTNIFDDEKIKYIETLPNGDETIVIWFRILCLAGKSNSGGLLMMTDKIAYTEEMLSSIFQREIMSIKLALNIFENLEMIERFENKIYLTNWEKHQSLDALEKKKIYDKEYQKKKRNEKLIVNKSYDNRTTVVENRSLDKELELEEEIDKDIKKKNGTNKFVKPTLEEVTAYCLERKNTINPQYFIDYQDAREWILSNGKKMKDWKATIRYWEQNGYNKPQSKESKPLPDYYNFKEEDMKWTTDIEEEKERQELFKRIKELD